jgi:hypothetical protein
MGIARAGCAEEKDCSKIEKLEINFLSLIG